MNKQKLLKKSVIRVGVICLIVLGAFGGLYAATDMMADSSAEKKTAAESTLGTDQGQITGLTSQLDKSGVAEKKFIVLQTARDNIDFSINSDALKDWLRSAKAQYRLSNTFKLSITPPKVSDNTEFTGMNYEVVEHPAMQLEFSALTDTHIFSFIDAFVRNAPGFVRVDGITLKRTGDIDSNSIALARSGGAPYLVDTKITFNWVGIREKAAPKDGAAPGAPGAPPAPGGTP